MAYKLNSTLSPLVLAGIKAGLDGGRIRLFSGPVPATPDTALDMVTLHTLLGIVSLNGLNVTGLTFAAAVGDTISKTGAEAWQGTYAFVGAQDTETSLLATFFRYGLFADTGQGVGTTVRLQGTIGTIGSGADLQRSNPTCLETEAFSIDSFSVRVGALG